MNACGARRWKREVVDMGFQHGEEMHRLAPNKLLEVWRSSQGWNMELDKGCGILGRSVMDNSRSTCKPFRIYKQTWTGAQFWEKMKSNKSFPVKSSEAGSQVLKFYLFWIWNSGIQCQPEAWGRKQDLFHFLRTYSIFYLLIAQSLVHLWPKNSLILQVFNKDAEGLEMVTSSYSCVWIWVIGLKWVPTIFSEKVWLTWNIKLAEFSFLVCLHPPLIQKKEAQM